MVSVSRITRENGCSKRGSCRIDLLGIYYDSRAVFFKRSFRPRCSGRRVTVITIFKKTFFVAQTLSFRKIILRIVAISTRDVITRKLSSRILSFITNHLFHHVFLGFVHDSNRVYFSN